jgi:hypothetical protein
VCCEQGQQSKSRLHASCSLLQHQLYKLAFPGFSVGRRVGPPEWGRGCYLVK